jgi:hypothetical protein
LAPCPAPLSFIAAESSAQRVTIAAFPKPGNPFDSELRGPVDARCVVAIVDARGLVAHLAESPIRRVVG